MPITRRDFLNSTVAGSVSLAVSGNTVSAQAVPEKRERASPATRLPIIICAANGYNYLDEAYSFLSGGGDTLEAALRVVEGPENDPNDESVGLGGHPNEEGVV